MMLPLDPVQPNADLPAQVEVVIVGGGIIGTATALCLAESGVSVLLCEKGIIGGEQSGRNLGWCRTLGRDLRELPLMIESLRLWSETPRRLNEDVGFRRNGIVHLCGYEADLARLSAWVDAARDMGAEAEILSPEGVAKLLPGAARTWVGAVYAPQDGGAEPQKGAPAFARAAQRAGAVISTNNAIRAIERTAGRVSGVVAERKTIRCQTVVIAGGIWSSQFLGSLGVRFPQLSVTASLLKTKPFDAEPVQSMTGTGFTTRKRLDGGYNVTQYGGEVHHITPSSLRFLRDFSAIAKSESRVKLKVSGASVARTAWARSWGPDEVSPFERDRMRDPKADADALNVGLKAFRAAFPAFNDTQVDEMWAGDIDVTPDALPVISPVDGIDGLFLSSGFSGHGFGIGPGAGRLTADMVMNRAGALELSPYRLNRFAGGAVRPGPAL